MWKSTRSLIVFILLTTLAPALVPLTVSAQTNPTPAATGTCKPSVSISNALSKTNPVGLIISGDVVTYTDSVTGKPCGPSAAPTSCSGFVNYWTSPVVCTGRLIGVVVATLFVSLGAFFLEMAGLLFNWLVNYTIVQFGDFYNAGVKQGIETAEHHGMRISRVDFDQLRGLGVHMKDVRQMRFLEIKADSGMDDLAQGGSSAFDQVFLFGSNEVRFIKGGDRETSIAKSGFLQPLRKLRDGRYHGRFMGFEVFIKCVIEIFTHPIVLINAWFGGR